MKRILQAMAVFALGCVASVAMGDSWTAPVVRVVVPEGATRNGGVMNGITTGTVMGTDKQRDTALILTCAHGFADTGGLRSPVNIQTQSGAQLPGQVVLCDMRHDIALVKVPLGGTPVQSAPVASQAPRVGDTVVGVGYNEIAQTPTAEQHRIATTNKYDGGALYSTPYFSQQGRSGGPLFNTRGELVGLLSATSQDGRHAESYFVSLPVVDKTLASVNLTRSIVGGSSARFANDAIRKHG